MRLVTMAIVGGVTGGLVRRLDDERFKAINDELGHTVGDAVLMAVAERMRGTVRADDTVARLGGDEFVVVVRADAAATVDDLADRLRLAVEAPIEEANRLMQVGVSCGTVVAEPGDDVDGLLRRADHAMYEAKRATQP
jgi:diguanylate cyclase (GGDEF)-like protein